VERALEELRSTLESGWLGMGPKVAEFEELMKDFLSVRHFIATSSGTAALHLAVRSLRLPRGAKVISSPITFISGNAVLLYEGLVPRFVQVNPWSGNIRSNLSRDALKGARAAIVTHIGGFPCFMKEIDSRTEDFAIPVIEDCAHALGGRYHHGRMIGDTDNTCCWSFHAVKNLGIGDGGGISTNDDDLAAEFRRLRWMGIDKSTHARAAGGYTTDYEIPELGFKYHMNDVSASIALANLETLETDNLARAAIAAKYMLRLKGCELPDYKWSVDSSSCHFVPVFVDDPAAVGAKLAERGIATTRHYKPNSDFKFMERKFEWALKAEESAREYYAHALVLPMFPSMTLEEVEYVIEQFNEVVAG
jgi:perosamine synthetase